MSALLVLGFAGYVLLCAGGLFLFCRLSRMNNPRDPVTHLGPEDFPAAEVDAFGQHEDPDGPRWPPLT